jgi:hypothetical protein
MTCNNHDPLTYWSCGVLKHGSGWNVHVFHKHQLQDKITCKGDYYDVYDVVDLDELLEDLAAAVGLHTVWFGAQLPY